MPEQLWLTPLKRGNIASGTTANSFTTFTKISPQSDVVISANQLTPGAAICVKASGRVGGNGTPALTLGLYYGDVSGVQICSTQPLTLYTAAVNTMWKAEFDIFVRADSVTGNCWVTGTMMGITSSTSAVVSVFGPGAAITIDTTASKAIVLAAQWNVQHGLNTITVDSWQVIG